MKQEVLPDDGYHGLSKVTVNVSSGIENGYNVTFNDENGDVLAFYSIKQGHSIEAPVYTCKAWQTEDGETVAFPYTPTGDVIFYANNSTYASQLYEFYGVDSAVYPYVFIDYAKNASNSTPVVKIGFCADTTFSSFLGKYKSVNLGITDSADIETIISKVMTNILPSELVSTGFTMFNDNNSVNTYEYCYANFDKTFTYATLYRLDE